MREYNSPHCIMSEFESDYKRIKYIKRLFRRYKQTEILKERLILNHIILLYNVFDLEVATRLLFFRVDKRDYDVLKTFLVYLNYIPTVGTIKGISGENITISEIQLDMDVVNKLRKI